MTAIRRKIAAALLLYDEEEENVAVLLDHKCFQKHSDIYKSREREGSYKIFIERYLSESETRFKAFFRVSRDLFYYILSAIEEDITTNPSYRYSKPISPEVMLCITLR